MTLKTRLAKLENEMLSQKPGWQWEVESLINSGKFSRKDALDLGTIVFDVWPQWFTQEDRERAELADQKAEDEMIEKLGRKQYYELLDRIYNQDITDEEIWAIIA